MGGRAGAGSPPGATGWEPWAAGWGQKAAGGLAEGLGSQEGGAGRAGGGWGLGHGCDTRDTRERFAKACERFANALATIPGQRLDPWTPTFKTGTLLLRIRENSQSDHNDTLNQTHKDSETILAVSDKTPCEPDP